jgi:hypothetical protein
LNEAITSENAGQIKEALERLKNSSMEIGKAIYSQGGSGEQQQEQEASSEEKQEEKKDEKN